MKVSGCFKFERTVPKQSYRAGYQPGRYEGEESNSNINQFMQLGGVTANQGRGHGQFRYSCSFICSCNTGLHSLRPSSWMIEDDMDEYDMEWIDVESKWRKKFLVLYARGAVDGNNWGSPTARSLIRGWQWAGWRGRSSINGYGTVHTGAGGEKENNIGGIGDFQATVAST